MTFCSKDAKIKAVYDFLVTDDGARCLIIVGLGGSGKSMAVNGFTFLSWS
jgi:ABC-type dipeptide/oligopeptide/nickel transport system ATPase component